MFEFHLPEINFSLPGFNLPGLRFELPSFWIENTEPQIIEEEILVSPPKPIETPVLVQPLIVKNDPVLKVSSHFSIDLRRFEDSGERDAILASSGMGKSYLTGVLMEETIESGGLLCVIDVEGEHWTLAERYPMLVIGGDHATLPYDETKIEAYINTILSEGISAIFDLSDITDSEEAFALIGNALFKAENDYKRKIRLIVDEAQLFAPQNPSGEAQKKSLAVCRDIAKRGRKRALDSLWATQRPASLNKDIMSQCNRFWFGGIQAPQDYKAIKPFLDNAGITDDQLRGLTKGQFFYYSEGKTIFLNRSRKRYCSHGGSTPKESDNRKRASGRDLSRILQRLIKTP